MSSLTITNPLVVDFYSRHPSVSFENMNLLLIGILNGVLSEISPDMDSSRVLTIMNEMKNINDRISGMSSENSRSVDKMMMEMKKEYIQDLRMILNNNNTQSLKPLLMEYTQVLQDKTKLIMDSSLLGVNQMVGDMRVEHKQSVENQVLIDKKVMEILSKFSSSNKKGSISEMVTYNILRSLYSENQLKIVNKTPTTGDILLCRNDKPIIMIENKDYTQNVPQIEVDKFIRDMTLHRYCGILISQNSEIANKRAFEINFHGNNVAIYVSSAKYDTTVIQIAIDTIDAIKAKLPLNELADTDNESSDSESSTDNMVVSLQDLEIINTEFNVFISQKVKHINSIKELSKKLITETEEFILPRLSKLILENCGEISTLTSSSVFKCERCNGRIFKNRGALSAHTKAHQNEDQKKERGQLIQSATGSVRLR